MARIRLNQEYRNKIANRIKVHLQQEDTQEKRKYDTLKADQIDINDQAWNLLLIFVFNPLNSFTPLFAVAGSHPLLWAKALPIFSLFCQYLLCYSWYHFHF